MTAGVGWTVPAGCDPKQQNEPACDKLKRSGRDLVAVLDTGHTMCNSSCVYALVGAAVREVGAGVELGVHSSSISFTLKRIDGQGHVTTMPTHVAPTVERKALESGYAKISAYLREMGISQDLLAAARGVEFSQLRFLTRDQIVAFGIDRRETVEGMWLFVDQTAARAPSRSSRRTAPGAFHKDFLSLTCRNASTLRLLYGRDAGPSVSGWSWPGRLRVTARGGSFLLEGPYRTAASGSRGPLYVGSVDVPSRCSAMRPSASRRTTRPRRSPALPARGAAPDGDATDGQGKASRASVTRLTCKAPGRGFGQLSRRCWHRAPSRAGDGVVPQI